MTSAPPLNQTSATPASGTRYLVALALFMMAGFAGLWSANRSFAPEMYSRSGVAEIAKAFARGENYAVFDLNINIRELRDEHLARMTKTPDVIVLGASHWQEAHSWLLSHKDFYNAHIHRDYYEDLLGMVEMLERHNRLPKQLIIAVRDNQFTPIKDRKDHLWLPGVPYYQAMAKRLGLEAHPYHETAPIARWRELLSLPMLHENTARWGRAEKMPHATTEKHFRALDTLLPGGSILWSKEHQQIFTVERTLKEVISFAEQRINTPPKVDPKGLLAFDRLLAHLRSKNVDLYLAHPPFNPDYYDRVMQGPYADGLRRIEQITKDFAKKYNAQIIGSFNPRDVGCDSSMYIDAEHANPDCLGRLLAQYAELDRQRQPEAVVAALAPSALPAPKADTSVMTLAQALLSTPAMIGAQPAKTPTMTEGAKSHAAQAETAPIVVAAVNETVEQPDAVKFPMNKVPVRLTPASPPPAARSAESAGEKVVVKSVAAKPAASAEPSPSVARTTRSATIVAATQRANGAKKSATATMQTNRYPNADNGLLQVFFGPAPKAQYVWPGDAPPARHRAQMSQSSQSRVR